MTSLLPLVLISEGQVDFECPHVDTPTGLGLISTWTLSYSGNYACNLLYLRDWNARDVSPCRGAARTVHLDEMSERSDFSHNASSMHFIAFAPAVQRATGNTVIHPAGTRLHVSRNLVLMDLRNTQDHEAEFAMPVRPLAGDIRINLDRLDLDPNQLLMPVWYRHGTDTPQSAHRSLELHGALDAELRAILAVSCHPSEKLIEPFRFI